MIPDEQQPLWGSLDFPVPPQEFVEGEGYAPSNTGTEAPAQHHIPDTDPLSLWTLNDSLGRHHSGSLQDFNSAHHLTGGSAPSGTGPASATADFDTAMSLGVPILPKEAPQVPMTLTTQRASHSTQQRVMGVMANPRISLTVRTFLTQVNQTVWLQENPVQSENGGWADLKGAAPPWDTDQHWQEKMKIAGIPINSHAVLSRLRAAIGKQHFSILFATGPQLAATVNNIATHWPPTAETGEMVDNLLNDDSFWSTAHAQDQTVIESVEHTRASIALWTNYISAMNLRMEKFISGQDSVTLPNVDL